MYVPAHFRLKDQNEAVALIREYPFATVLSVVEGVPAISYLPCLVLQAEPTLVIAAHFARANPHWRLVEAHGATLLFHGPHGYISAGWYTARHRDVPTWNYAAVHVGATAALVDEDETRRIVTLLTDAFERGRPDPWSIEEADEDYIFTQLQGIVGVHFTATAVDAKFKLSQNRTAEDRSGALNGLRATGHESDRQLAELMDHMSKPPLTV